MNEFLTEKYDEIVKMAEKITQHRDYREVAHYVIEQFMQHQRAEELIEKGEAMRFLSGMIHRNFHSSTSPYHKIFRQKNRVHAKHTIEDSLDEPYDYENDLLLDAIEGILEDMQAESMHTWYIAVLFQMWIETPNYSEISRNTKIPRTSVSFAVEEAIQEIQKRLKDNGITH